MLWEKRKPQARACSGNDLLPIEGLRIQGDFDESDEK